MTYEAPASTTIIMILIIVIIILTPALIRLVHILPFSNHYEYVLKGYNNCIIAIIRIILI